MRVTCCWKNLGVVASTHASAVLSAFSATEQKYALSRTLSQRTSKQGPCIPHTKTNTTYPNVPVGQDARIHVSEPDFEALTQGGLLDSSIDGGITIVEFERIMRAQLILHAQARFRTSVVSSYDAILEAH